MMVQHIQASCVLVSDKLTEIIRMLTTRSIIREVTIPGGPSHVTRHTSPCLEHAVGQHVPSFEKHKRNEEYTKKT